MNQHSVKQHRVRTSEIADQKTKLRDQNCSSVSGIERVSPAENFRPDEFGRIFRSSHAYLPVKVHKLISDCKKFTLSMNRSATCLFSLKHFG